MKKNITNLMLELLLILALLFNLIGCGSDDPKDNQSASIEEDIIEEDSGVEFIEEDDENS